MTGWPGHPSVRLKFAAAFGVPVETIREEDIKTLASWRAAGRTVKEEAMPVYTLTFRGAEKVRGWPAGRWWPPARVALYHISQLEPD